MALKNFQVVQGLNILDPNTCADPRGLIYGETAPVGTTGETAAAGIGMIYINKLNGDFFKKVADTDSASDWEVIGADIGASATGVTSSTTVDCIQVDDAKGAEWEVEIEDVDNPENRVFFKVFAGHNGTDAADATTSDYNVFSNLCFGTEPSYDVSVALTGVGAAQQLCLVVASAATNGVDVTARRTDIK